LVEGARRQPVRGVVELVDVHSWHGPCIGMRDSRAGASKDAPGGRVSATSAAASSPCSRSVFRRMPPPRSQAPSTARGCGVGGLAVVGGPITDALDLESRPPGEPREGLAVEPHAVQRPAPLAVVER
jgi:hypothetical protein